MLLKQFRALTFDVYGTLIDWERGIIEGLKPLIQSSGQIINKKEILESHAHYESEEQQRTPNKPYCKVLEAVYRRLAGQWQISIDLKQCELYGRSIQNWPAFPDSQKALKYLRKHFTLIVLSNVDNKSFCFSNEKLGKPFHITYTAEDIGHYKPSPKTFEFMLDDLFRKGFEKNELLHVAESMFHDLVPANKFGIANCHIYRRYKKSGFGAAMTPRQIPHCDLTFRTMAEFAEAHRREFSD